MNFSSIVFTLRSNLISGLQNNKIGKLFLCTFCYIDLVFTGVIDSHIYEFANPKTLSMVTVVKKDGQNGDALPLPDLPDKNSTF